MQFKHIIVINDPLNPLIDPLTRDQIWRGLVLRAETPGVFVPWLDSCKLFDRTPESVSRELRYGDLTIVDRVTFVPQQEILYQVPQQKDIAASSLCMSIEEPQADLFIVRFAYDDGIEETEGSVDAMYNEFRQSAYLESDLDTIRVIRQLAQGDQLDEPHP
jgi:hypothetical protein